MQGPVPRAASTASVKLGYLAIPLPEFHVVALDKLFGRFDCGVVIRAIELDRTGKMPVAAARVVGVFFNDLPGLVGARRLIFRFALGCLLVFRVAP
jgi:hypothetical protein